MAAAGERAIEFGMEAADQRMSELRARAEASVSAEALANVFGKSDSDLVMNNRRAEAAWGGIDLVPRVLVDMSQSTTATSVLGQPVRLPVIVGPTGEIQRALHPDGELAVARAAETVGAAMILSTFASYSFADVARCTSHPLWFQLYFMTDRGLTAELVRRAEVGGCSAIVLTVDVNGAIPNWGRLQQASINASAVFEGLDLSTAPNELVDPRLDWDGLEWLCAQTSLPIIIKGIQSPQDAALAAGAGASGIVVSNHGGFALEGSAAPVELLPAVVQATGDELEIYVDGGVRRGTDILKALALGARAVLIGRPMLWGLMAGGEAGVQSALEILRRELLTAQLLCGVSDITQVPAELTRVSGFQPQGEL
jgi:4-hydroxymandelate oxidase